MQFEPTLYQDTYKAILLYMSLLFKMIHTNLVNTVLVGF